MLIRHAYRGLFVLVALVAASAALGSSAAYAVGPPAPVVIEMDAADPHWVQGQVVVPAPPEQILKSLRDVSTWPTLFTDIARLEVKEHRGALWEIDLETRTLDHGMLACHLNMEGSQGRLWARSRGVTAEVFVLVRNGPSPGTSNVVYSEYIKATGLARLILSDHALHEKQVRMVTQSLSDIYAAFAR